MPWKATGKSVIGTLHQKHNLPCQDYNDYRILHENEIIVGSVADGAGSAKYSEHGAKVTVETVIAQITQELEKHPNVPNFFLDLLESGENQIDLFYRTLMQEIQEKLAEKAQQLNCSLKDLACTLIAFIASGEGMVALQIGDGFLVTRTDGETEYRLVFQPYKGEFANETTFVTSTLAQETIQIKILKQKTVFICAATDGLERVAIRFMGWQPFAPFFQPLESFMDNYIPEVGTSDVSSIDSQNQTNTENPTKIEQDIPYYEKPELKDISNQDNQEQDEKLSYLENFLNSNRLNNHTNDDKTLLLCFYQPLEL